jgi:hypothetical protein
MQWVRLLTSHTDEENFNAKGAIGAIVRKRKEIGYTYKDPTGFLQPVGSCYF